MASHLRRLPTKTTIFLHRVLSSVNYQCHPWLQQTNNILHYRPVAELLLEHEGLLLLFSKGLLYCWLKREAFRIAWFCTLDQITLLRASGASYICRKLITAKFTGLEILHAPVSLVPSLPFLSARVAWIPALERRIPSTKEALFFVQVLHSSSSIILLMTIQSICSSTMNIQPGRQSIVNQHCHASLI